MATLLILKGANQGQRVTLEGDRITLGRNRDCSVVIDFPAVSREHANILRVAGKFYIEDRESRNGTFVNNQQIAGRTLLKDNDRIKICDFLCTYHEGPTLKPLPAGYQAEVPEQPEEEEHSSTVEAKIARLSNSQLLESQPADKISAMLDISTFLARTLELDALLPRIADSLFQLFRQADRCFLILREEPSGKLYPKLIKTRRAGGETSARFSRTIARQCMETAQALLSEDAASDSRFGLAQSIADFRIRSVMCGPLCSADGKAFGVIQLDTQDRSKKFTSDDLKFLLGVSNYAAIALENVQLHQNLVVQERGKRDLELGRQVQRGFLPQKLPAIPGYQFFADYEPAQEIGGDYYDFIPLSGGRLGVLLGDVAGKGVPAALLMAKLSAEARFCMLSVPEPAAAITKLNDVLLQAGLMDRFVTLAAIIIDPTLHTVTLVNAGHLAPLILRQSVGTLEDTLTNDVTGLPLGVMEGLEYASCKIDMKPGDAIFAFTDGIIDALDVQNNAFGMKGLRAALLEGTTTPGKYATASSLGDQLLRAVKHHGAGRTTQHDDIALVCFSRLT